MEQRHALALRHCCKIMTTGSYYVPRLRERHCRTIWYITSALFDIALLQVAIYIPYISRC